MCEGLVRRVLMTGDTVGGVWTFTLELARALGAHGIEVLLATMGGDPAEEQRAEAAAIANLRLRTSRNRLEWMEDSWQDVEASGRWLCDLEKQFRPDVIHLNNYGFGSVPWQAPVLLTAHSCVLSWWAAVKREPLPGNWTRYRQAVECSLRAADAITAPTRAMRRTVEENYGPDLPERRVIPNGRSRAGYQARSRKEPFVLAAGRVWDEAKNIAAVAKAAGSLAWPVYVAGENIHPDGQVVEAPGCRMLGRLSQRALAGWYERAAIYALPARYEPFGLSALEAGLAGCALVLGDIASLREVWGDAAMFAPAGDAGRLAAILRELIDKPALRAEMGRRALERALWFTPERMASGYMEVYGGLAAQRRLACAS